ncbi:EAL domain-containing protein [Mitsuokella multacida]|uniref:EAL domain-containing protein n=1 Tax=Mitsuokella multacida TaxID=52226 RepID=UPI0039F54946
MRRANQSRQEFLRDAADILQREWREYHLLKSCPVFFNITNFHLYNATHGFRQGDLCLQHIEGILQDVFPECPVLHLGADNFAVLAEEANVQTRIDKACQRVQAYIGNPNIALKAGIRFLSGPRSLKDLNVAFDSEAKIACDTIKKDASRHWAIYTQELGLRHKMQNYVREYLDQALEKGFIRLYLQPIIRTLTGKLVGAEVLARWESPQYGMISPAIFIPVLEEAHLIHKLDAYILNAVAKMTRQNLDNGLPALPVSVNLSRLDFILQDPFATTEAIREKYDLPLGLLQVEVTENALVDKMEPVLDGIRRFQQGGYPVLLDDFGSGYSSLNVLKDYDFDTIKFDMKFLHPFTEKSRKILKSLVSMAKDLHIHTLAEGAETKEQCDFLREIGCEKIQGYYYGKPIPCEDFHQYALDQGLQVETRAEAQLFDQAGLIDLNQPIPISIVHDDTQEMTMLQANGLYLESLHSIGTRDVQRVNVNLRSAYFPMNEKFRRFADRLRMTGQWETMTYVDDGQYMRLKAKEIATVDKESIYQVGLYNISAEEALDDANAHRFDRLLRNVLLTYDAIWYLNLDENLVEIIETLTSIRVGTQFHNVASALRQFAGHYVHPSDRERFLAFTDPKTFYERAASNPQSFLSAPFRILLADGRYAWLYFTSMALVKSTSREMLVCLCKDFMGRQPNRQAIIRQMLETYGLSKEFFAAGPDTLTASIWHVLMDDLGIEFFWKDRQHRFRGASKAFLKGRGVKDVAEILGKTDAELGWLLHTTHAQETEEKVMQTGEPQLDVQEYLSIGHRIQEIRTFEYPIRESGQVVGVFIRINSLEDAPERRKQDLSLGLIDEETGLLSYSGMLMDGLQYADEFRLHGDDYTATLVDVPEFDAIGMKYGKGFRQHLLQKIVALLQQHLPAACSIARIGSCCFLILSKTQQDASIQQALLQLVQEVHDIEAVNGHPCHLFLHYAKGHGSEVRSIDGLLRLLVQRLHRAEENLYGVQLYSNDSLVFPRELFDKMEFSVVIIDPDTHELLYMNQAQRQELGLLPDAPLTGKTCYKTLAGNNAVCEICYEDKLRPNACFTNIYHNPVTATARLLCHTLVPWNGKPCHFCLCIDLDYYMQRHKTNEQVLFQELSVNDIIRAGMYELDPENGLRKMMNRLGGLLRADHVLIAEEIGTSIHFSYLWETQTTVPFSRKIKPFPREDIQPLYERFIREPVFTIDDVEQFCHESGYAPRLPNLQRLIFARLRLDDHIYGYLEVVNPAPEQMEKALPLLRALARFFSILLRNRNLMQRIDRLSKVDPLTGVMNRRGLLDALKDLPAGTYAFFFGDLNGLKETNDKLGHDAGDRLIQSAASVFVHSCPTNAVFRMGGDEFLMIEAVQDEQEASAINDRLHDRFRTAGISISLGFSMAALPAANIDTVLAEADCHMYKEKVEHHKTRHQHQETNA